MVVASDFFLLFDMGKGKKRTRNYTGKKRIKATDTRLKTPKEANPKLAKRKDERKVVETKRADQFFSYNTQLGPPYHVLVDTSFLNFSIVQKVDLVQGMIDCLCAKATPYISDCVIAELERHGHRFGLALRLAKDPRVKRIKCMHDRVGYADDCLVHTAKSADCYIVATCDRELKRRLRKIPGVPIMTVGRRRYMIERLPDADFL
eukprot:gnl/Dysnectes_brevis/1253_a1400_3260.p1 GENE.gnl/Dysnectes_brevis/1253_a1400_3260~~gnl/Dysnectes_brevis/1253_a1400_3260.p1  ORF type:complete len:205 (+),score=1.05 gnl/Dysnectes_brevis/1253_a1400_3260:38-652(+)